MDTTVNADSSAKTQVKKKRPKAKKNASNVRGPAWTFPKLSLEDSIRIAQVIEEKHAGKPIKSEELLKMVGYHSMDDWRFWDLLRAANMYGLVEGIGKSVTVSLTPIGNDIVAPKSPSQRQQALVKAFKNVELFQKVSDFYHEKKIPEDEYFSNTLAREFGIQRERIDVFIKVFTNNLSYLKAFTANPGDRPTVTIGTNGLNGFTPAERATNDVAIVSTVSEEGVREFLDTCFVLMPFGEWPDRYYKEIYVHAIKDAGFEPLRGDGIFDSGSVMEQIWAHIKKAKVLVADLTGRNPNVFYELGLAHAISKPVVFVSGNIDDVPFDVRHLRVVTYDVREPNWGEKLKRDITMYLKTTKADPKKSIPQPFRESTNIESEEEILATL